MYARHRVGVIIPGFDRDAFLSDTIASVPSYVDCIYIVGNNKVQNDFTIEDFLGDQRQVKYIQNGHGGSIDTYVREAYRKALDDGIDIATIMEPEYPLSRSLLSYMLDPIVWGTADYTQWRMDRSLNEVCSYPTKGLNHTVRYTNPVSSESVERDLASFIAGTVSVSRSVMEMLNNTPRHRPLKKVLAAIPCHNEELAIASIVFRSKQHVNDVLVVDDGSTDHSAELAEKAGATVVKHTVNQGYGGALRSCFAYARQHDYDAMVILDGDGQHDPVHIPKLLKTMEEDDADVVIGSRFLDRNSSIPLYRRFGMRVLDACTGLAGNIQVTDSQSGFRAYGRRAIDTIQIKNAAMGAGSEILTQIQKNNLQVSEAPIVVRYDIDNSSSQNPIAHGYDVLDSIIWHVAQKRPLLYIGVPGFALTLIGILLGIFLLHLYNESHYFSLPIAMLISVFLILGALGLFMGLTFNVIQRMRTS